MSGEHGTSEREAGGVGRLYAVLWRYAGDRRVHIVASSILLVAAQAVRLTVPWFFGHAVDALQVQGSAGAIEAWEDLLLMLGAVVLAWTLHGPARVIERFTGLAVRERFADRLHERVINLPVRWHEAHHSGDTLYRIGKAQASLSSFAQSQFIYLQNTLSIVGPIVALLIISVPTGVSAMVGYAVIAVFVVRIDALMVTLVQEEHRAERRYNSALVDCLGNIATVLTLRLQAPVQRMLLSRLGATFGPLRRTIVFNEVKWGGIDLLNNAIRLGLVAIYAGLDWRRHGAISVGTAVTVHQYAQQIGSVVAGMAMQWNELVRQKTEVAAVDDILEHPHTGEKGEAVPEAWREIRVERLRFIHPAKIAEGRGAPPTLDDVSLTLRRGARIALVGGSGAGKSSLLRVLAGLMEADEITLSVDGERVPALRHLGPISMLLPQDPEVFESSVFENLTLGLPYERAEVERACELAGFAPVVSQLPLGFETRVAERGLNLSGGQKQRLALARGLLAARHARLVLLDEATSSVDAETEARIYDGLMAAFEQACILSSIHRLHLLPRFDTVILMDRGRIVDSGPPLEVQARCPRFFAHWRAEAHGAVSLRST